MPIKPIDYSKSVIYKIVCNDTTVTEIYVGSTTDFTRRKKQHKHSSEANSERKVYQSIAKNGGWNNWTMLEIEKFPCADGNESRTRERYHYELLNASLNSVCPSRTNEEYYEVNKEAICVKQKEYHEANKESRNVKMKEYREVNKEAINVKKKEHREANRKTINAKQNEHREANKESINAKKKEYYEANKDSINAKQKEYREANKEAINSRRKEHYDLNKESINARRRVNKFDVI